MNDIDRRSSLYGFEMREVDQRRSPDRRTYDIKQLWQRNHEIVNLSARGFKNTEIAEILNITPQCVSNTLNSELGEMKLSEIRKERDEEAKRVSERIRILTNKALDTYHNIFEDESGEVNLKDKGHFAESFLKDMSGLRAPTRIQTQSVNMNLTKDEIEEFKRRGMAAAQESGIVIDAEVEEVNEASEETNRD